MRINLKSSAAWRRKALGGHLRSRQFWSIVSLVTFCLCVGSAAAQEPAAPPETGEIVVSATRLPVPEEDVPASVTVLTDDDFEIHQTERAADALREVPGLSVVQTGTAGQLTSVFMRGLRSEHTQVLIDGVPINQGLQGAFNFADLTLDNIARIEIVDRKSVV